MRLRRSGSPPLASQELGFGIVATRGTAAHLRAAGVECRDVLKIQEGRPNASDLMKNKDIAMMFITSTGDEGDVRDGRNLRREALGLKIPIITTLAGCRATVQARARPCASPSYRARAHALCVVQALTCPSNPLHVMNNDACASLGYVTFLCVP